jgi:hypothetical protein
VYLVRVNKYEKNMHVGIAHLVDGDAYERDPSRGKETHELSNTQDNKSVNWYAFTTRKFPSASHAAKMKSEDRLGETK